MKKLVGKKPECDFYKSHLNLLFRNVTSVYNHHNYLFPKIFITPKPPLGLSPSFGFHEQCWCEHWCTSTFEFLFSVLFWYCYGQNCVPLKFIHWSPNPSVTAFVDRASKEVTKVIRPVRSVHYYLLLNRAPNLSSHQLGFTECVGLLSGPLLETSTIITGLYLEYWAFLRWSQRLGMYFCLYVSPLLPHKTCPCVRW